MRSTGPSFNPDSLYNNLAGAIAATLDSIRDGFHSALGTPFGRDTEASARSHAATNTANTASDCRNVRIRTFFGAGIALVVVMLASILLLATIMRDQAVLAFDTTQAGQQRRINAFVADVRLAADALEDERGDCSAGPAAKRAACLSAAARTSQTAVTQARDRYALDQNRTSQPPVTAVGDSAASGR